MSKKPQVVIVGGGMITRIQLLPTIYHLQRENAIGDIHLCALNAEPIKEIQNDETLKKAFQIAGERLKYIYVGNIYIPGTADTYCPKCQKVLISRSGYSIDIIGIEDKRCKKCGTSIDIIMTHK